MNISVNHKLIKHFDELKELVTDEIAAFCIAWKMGLDTLLSQDVQLIINRKRYGYEVKYHYAKDQLNWLFQLELYYPNVGSAFERKISYVKINKFATLPMYQGSGTKVFEHLMNCTKELGSLSMIRLRSVRNAISFWKKQGFKEQNEAFDWIDGNPVEFDEGCQKRPQTLNHCHFIYDILECDCEFCQAYYKKKS